MKLKTVEVVKSFGIDQRNFQAMRNICDWFMNCAELFVRHRTLNYQKLLADFKEKLLSFQHHVIQLNKSVDIKTCKAGVSYLEKNIGESKRVLFKKHSESSNLFKAPEIIW